MTPLLQALPIDPEDLDATRPDDLTDCDVCVGTGLIDQWVDGDLVDVPCRRCDGTGERGAA